MVKSPLLCSISFIFNYLFTYFCNVHDFAFSPNRAYRTRPTDIANVPEIQDIAGFYLFFYLFIFSVRYSGLVLAGVKYAPEHKKPRAYSQDFSCKPDGAFTNLYYYLSIFILIHQCLLLWYTDRCGLFLNMICIYIAFL